MAILLVAAPALARMAMPVADMWGWDHRVRRVTLLHLNATGWGVIAAILNCWHMEWWRSHMRLKAWIGVILTLLAIAGTAVLMTCGWQIFANSRADHRAAGGVLVWLAPA